jgi:hypothetical protein
MTVTADVGATFASARLLAGPNGALVLVWPGATGTAPAIQFSRYDPATGGWSPATTIFDDGLLRTDLTAVSQPNGNVALAYAEQPQSYAAVTGYDDRTIQVPQPAESASLAVAELEAVFESGEVSTAAGLSWTWLAALLAGLFVMGIVVVVWGLMRRARA